MAIAPTAQRMRALAEEWLDATGARWSSWIGGAVVVVVLGVVGWWFLREDLGPVESRLPTIDVAAVPTAGDGDTATSLAGSSAGSSAASSSSHDSWLVVDVVGAVTSPGVYRLAAGARVVDAIEAAGGVTAEAAPGGVNRAAPLTDGSQVHVPAIGEPPRAAVSAPGPGGTGGPGDADLVDLNVADAAALDALPGIGPATAAAILDHRDRNGPFRTIEGLLEVRGIGEAKLAQLRPLVRV